MSIIPGIETAAPERTETSSGLSVVAEALAGALLERRDVLVDLVRRDPSGTSPPPARYARHASVVIVNPSGTGTPSCGHLGEADPLPAEELPTAARVLGEVEDVAHLRGESTRTRQ